MHIVMVAMSTQRIPLATPDEYLEFDRSSEFKNEFVFGEIVAMAGGTARHSRINDECGYRLGEPAV